MKLVNNNRYLNKSLEPVIVNEKDGIEYTATRLDNTKYQVLSGGLTILRKNIIINDVYLNIMFDNKKVSYITDMFRTVYCNENGDWFDMSDLDYGFMISKLVEEDIRFIKVKDKLYTPIVKINSKVKENLEQKYRQLREALKGDKYEVDKLKAL